MALGSVNSGGGNSGKSDIIVTAQAGSAVSCTNGSDVKTAPEKDGTWTFRGCGIGTWTVHILTEGYDELTYTIEITEADQRMRYYIATKYDVFLFNLGDQCVDITGGWEMEVEGGYGNAAFGATNMWVESTNSTGAYGAWFCTKNKVDLSQYRVIEFEVEGKCNLIVGSVFNDPYSKVARQTVSVSTAGTYELDISEVSGSYYVFACSGVSNSGAASYTKIKMKR